MATIAVGVAAAATVAATAYKASQAGKGGGKIPAMQGPQQFEQIFNRGTRDILDEERHVMEDALGQASFMTPELYKVLGYEPVYDDRGVTPDSLKALSQKSDELNKALLAGREQRAASVGQLRDLRKQLREARKAGDHTTAQDLKGQIKDINQANRDFDAKAVSLRTEAGVAQQALSDAQSQPMRIVGFNKLDRPIDPTGSPGGLYQMAFDLENESLVRALKGEEPVDGTLKTHWDQQEQQLRARLRAQLGPDYETSTAGSQALAVFDTQRNNAFATFNQDLVQRMSAETDARATNLSNLRGALMQQMMFPANQQLGRAAALGEAANSRINIAQLAQNERTAQFKSAESVYGNRLAQHQAQVDAIAGLIQAGGSAVGAVGGGYGGSLNSSAASPGTVQVPSYASASAANTLSTANTTGLDQG